MDSEGEGAPPSYLDLLPPEVRETVAVGLIPVMPEVPAGLSVADFERGTRRGAEDYQHMMNDTLNDYFFRTPDAADIPYAPGEEGKEVRRTMDHYIRQRDHHLKLADEIKAIPVVKHIRKRRRRRRFN